MSRAVGALASRWGIVPLIPHPVCQRMRASMQLPDEVVVDVRTRLRRIAGQVPGVERMLDEGRACREVVAQVSAAAKALEQAGFRLVAAGLTYCIEHPDEAAADGYPMDAVQKMFMKPA